MYAAEGNLPIVGHLMDTMHKTRTLQIFDYRASPFWTQRVRALFIPVTSVEQASGKPFPEPMKTKFYSAMASALGNHELTHWPLGDFNDILDE